MDSVFVLEFPQRSVDNAVAALHSSSTYRVNQDSEEAGYVLVAWAVGYDSAPVDSNPARMIASQKMCAVPLRNQTDCGPRDLSAKSCAALGCCAQDIQPTCFAPFQNKTVHIEVKMDETHSIGGNSSGGSSCFQRYDMFGASQGKICAKNGKISLIVGGAPVYLLSS